MGTEHEREREGERAVAHTHDMMYHHAQNKLHNIKYACKILSSNTDQHLFMQIMLSIKI